MTVRLSIFGQCDPRDEPAYTVAEAARYLRIPGQTLRTWVVGRSPFRPLIEAPADNPTRLSFNNVVEAYALRALRTRHGVSIGNAREAIEFAGRKYQFAGRKYQVERILLSGELRTAAGDLFLSKYGELINLNRSGQLAMARLLKDCLRRITYDELNLPIRLSVSKTDDDIVMDPWIAFGRPVVFGRGISTAAIVDRVDAGETIDEIAQDYKLTTEQVEAAIVYDQAA